MREQGVMHWSKQKSDRSHMNDHEQPLMAMSGA